MDFSELSLIKVDSSTIIKPFDCGDDDLNEFLLEKAILFQTQLLAVTYVLENRERTIAFFSIFNDSLRVEEADFVSKTKLKEFLSHLVPHSKRHLKTFPALKIGRLAVCKQVQKGGLGRKILDFIIDIAIKQNDNCACRLITVDAYAKSIGFYEKMKFSPLTTKDEKKDTRQMFLDLTPYINSVS